MVYQVNQVKFGYIFVVFISILLIIKYQNYMNFKYFCFKLKCLENTKQIFLKNYLKIHLINISKILNIILLHQQFK